MLVYVAFRFQIRGLTNQLTNPAPCDIKLGKMSFVMMDKDNERPHCLNRGWLFLCEKKKQTKKSWIIFCFSFDKPKGNDCSISTAMLDAASSWAVLACARHKRQTERMLLHTCLF